MNKKILENKIIISVCTVVITVLIYMGVGKITRLIGAYVDSKDFPMLTMEEHYASSHIPNRAERKVAEEFTDLVEECYVENRTDERLGPINDLESLKDLYGHRSDGENIRFSISTCKIKGSRGIVCVNQSNVGSMVWLIEKKDGVWIVIKAKRMFMGE